MNYSNFVRDRVVADKIIHIISDEAVDISVNNLKVSSIKLKSGTTCSVDALIVTTGTFLRGKIHVGDIIKIL